MSLRKDISPLRASQFYSANKMWYQSFKTFFMWCVWIAMNIHALKAQTFAMMIKQIADSDVDYNCCTKVSRLDVSYIALKIE